MGIVPLRALQAHGVPWPAVGRQTPWTWSDKLSRSPARAGACPPAESPHALGSRPYVSAKEKTTNQALHGKLWGIKTII